LRLPGIIGAKKISMTDNPTTLEVGNVVYVRGEGSGTIDRFDGQKVWVSITRPDAHDKISPYPVWTLNDRNLLYRVASPDDLKTLGFVEVSLGHWRSP
jgi:hypothetical protein